MNHEPTTPFDSIESAQDFVSVLAEAVIEAKLEIETDLQRELDVKAPRRRDALRIALYSLEKLETHMNRSRRILNDLRSLRRLLFEERRRVAEILTRPGSPALPPAIKRAVVEEVRTSKAHAHSVPSGQNSRTAAAA